MTAENHNLPAEGGTPGRDDDPACEPFHELVGAYLDRELEPESLERLEEHLETCPSCRQRLDDYRQVDLLVDGVVKDGVVEEGVVEEGVVEDGVQGGVQGGVVPNGVVPNVPSKTLEEVRRRLRRGRRIRLVSLAAAVLLAAVGLRLWLPGTAEEPETAILQNLDVLESIHAETMHMTMNAEGDSDMSLELVELLLGNGSDQGANDPELFDYVLEEELENL